MRVFRRGRVYYAQFYENGRRVQRSTKCTDKRAAETVARQWEREAADPVGTRQRTATLTDALDRFLDQRQEQADAKRLSQSTVDFYRRKTGHLTRVFEYDERGEFVGFRLAELQARHVDDYISTRRAEGASESTISKELVALRAALKQARRASLWSGDPGDVCPVGFSPEYKPRTRFLELEEMQKLLPQLPADQAAQVAFMVGTSAEWAAVGRALREDIDLDRSVVLVRGSKRATRFRRVPLVSDRHRSLVEYALEHAEGKGERLFLPWSNVRRDLIRACDNAKLDPVSPNDLRRTCGTWLRQMGAPPDLIAAVMGHSDSRMVERVYGRLPVDDLAKRLAMAMGPEQCSVFAAAVAGTIGLGGLDTDPQNEKTPPKAGSAVPRDRIELPTRGFSIPCSTN